MEPVRWRQEVPASKAPHSYLLEHLATFSGISKQGSLLSPEDGMRQLRQMALTQGHWVLRVRLIVQSPSMMIIDATSGEEMEVISLDMVRQLTAFVNQSGKETYNNVLLFVTSDASTPKSVTEMHIFQCLDESAQAIVDDINSSKVNRSQRESVAYQRQAPAEWQQRTQEYEAAAKRTANAIGAFDPSSQPSQLRKSIHQGGGGGGGVGVGGGIGGGNVAFGGVGGVPESNPHVMEGVELLNHCFDDIEQFMNQLQKVANAYKELEVSRHGQRAGMLTLRVRNPSQQNFVDIFQKFKLSFNLLAKLKPYIHDPNAPELVHFLFTPLGLIVEASSDQRHGPGGVASTVISPLLTAEAVDLLSNCLTSKEMELLRRLGDAWAITRKNWGAYVPPYVPRFYDGWNPPMDWLNDDSFGMSDKPQVSFQAGTLPTAQRPMDYLAQPVDIYGMPANSSSRSPSSSLINGDDGRGEQAFLRDLMSRNALIYQVIQGRKTDKKPELSIEKGEILEILENNRQWWKARNSRGLSGFVPNTLLQPISRKS